MRDTIRFETPENILVSYRLAGPGTRFIAFFFDMLIILLTLFLLGIVGMLSLFTLGEAYARQVAPYIFAIVYIVGAGFVMVGYFALFEWGRSGQTPGKRAMHIRVVMDQGFALSLSGVAIRNIFRLIDTMPILWVVPVVTHKVQRLGDLVAGTVVIAEEEAPVSALRELLAARPADDARFTFTGDQLARLRPVDVQAVEAFLERRESLNPEHRLTLLRKLVRGLTTRLALADVVTDEEGERFLEELLGAYARREAREIV